MTNEKAKGIGRRIAMHLTGVEREAMEVLLAANEKQIAKQPDVFRGYSIDYPICPSCKIPLKEDYSCWKCGQKIMWKYTNKE